MRPKLRDGKIKPWPYPKDSIPPKNVYRMTEKIVYHVYTGKDDLAGDEWGDVLAHGIGGEHRSSPLGLADVTRDGFAWSVKSVKSKKPHNTKIIRVISGRNSPDYSYGIKDPHKDVQKTGDAVLGIWNGRMKIATKEFHDLRIAVLVRDMDRLEFTYFELDAKPYDPTKYVWKENGRNNLEGFDKTNDEHKFTWQPHGGQFTIKYKVPESARNFTSKRPPTLDYSDVLEDIGYDDDWVDIK